MPTTYYAINKVISPSTFVKTYDPVTKLATFTTVVAEVFEWAVQADAQTVANELGANRFHVGASPKPH